MGTQVAVKIVVNRFSRRDLFSLAKEAQLWQTLRHPQLVQFLGSVQFTGLYLPEDVDHELDPLDTLGLVTEYVPNGSLSTLLYDTEDALTWEGIDETAFGLHLCRLT